MWEEWVTTAAERRRSDESRAMQETERTMCNFIDLQQQNGCAHVNVLAMKR